MTGRRSRALLLATGALLVVTVIAVTAVVVIGVPSRATYEYVELDSASLSAGDRYRPELSRYRGDEIPRVYEGLIGLERVVIADVASPYEFSPALRISATPPSTLKVEDLSPSCAHEVRESEQVIVIWWGTCVAIGDPVSFVLELNGANGTLPVNGTVKQAGKFTDWEAL